MVFSEEFDARLSCICVASVPETAEALHFSAKAIPGKLRTRRFAVDLPEAIEANIADAASPGRVIPDRAGRCCRGYRPGANALR